MPSVPVITSREFNQDSREAKKAALQGPLFITDLGNPTHVLLNIDEYHHLTEEGETIVDLLASDDGEIEFDPKPLKGSIYRSADFR